MSPHPGEVWLADLGLAAKTDSKNSFLNRESVVNVQGLGSIPVVRLERKLGKLPHDVLASIKRALIFVLELNTE